MTGMLFYTLALPRFHVAFLAWLVAFFWTPIIRREHLTGTVPYRKIYIASVVFWAIAVHWVCYPYWATCFGWAAMAFYLAIYPFLFFVAARSLVHTFRFPVVFAMPIAWVGSAWLQRHMLGGFSFAAIEHTQMFYTSLIQIADLIGEYGLGAFIIFIGSVLGRNLPLEMKDGEKIKFDFPLIKQWGISLIHCILGFLIVLLYGNYRLNYQNPENAPIYKVALLQGVDRAMIDAPEGWYEKVYENYINLGKEAVRVRPQTDLMIWPESTSIYPWHEILPPDQTGCSSEEQEYCEKVNRLISSITQYYDTAMVYGVASYVEDLENGENDELSNYNSALLMDRSGNAMARYDKMQLVMFGEYIPFSDWIPDSFFLKTLCQRAHWGKEPRSFPLPDRSGNIIYTAAANICFESSIPQLIRSQVLTLRARDEEPDILINISNDGWFRHSSQIDMHLASNIFRAVENRKPFLSATNAGFSVHIDGNGRILSCGERKVPSVVLADVQKDGRIPPYHLFGDSVSCFCFLFAFSSLITRWLQNRTKRKL